MQTIITFSFMNDVKGNIRQQVWDGLGSIAPTVTPGTGASVTANVLPDDPKFLDASVMKAKQVKDTYAPRVTHGVGEYLSGLHSDIGAGVGVGSLIKGAGMRASNKPGSAKYIRGTQLKASGLETLSSPKLQRNAANRVLIGGTVGAAGLGLGVNEAMTNYHKSNINERIPNVALPQENAFNDNLA